MIENIQNNYVENIANRSKPTRYGKLNNQLQLSANHINSSVINLETGRECRICLEGNEDEQNKIISPCACIGSVRFIHEKCFGSWIQKQYENKSLRERQNMMKVGIRCELCHEYVTISFNQEIKYCDKEYFEKAFAENTVQFILFILGCFILLALIIYLIIYIIGNSLDFHALIVQSLMVLSSLGFLIVFLIAFIVFLIRNYGVRYVTVVSLDKKKENNKRIKNHLVVIPAPIIEEID